MLCLMWVQTAPFSIVPKVLMSHSKPEFVRLIYGWWQPVADTFVRGSENFSTAQSRGELIEQFRESALLEVEI